MNYGKYIGSSTKTYNTQIYRKENYKDCMKYFYNDLYSVL